MKQKLFKSFRYKAVQIGILTICSLFLIPILLHYWNLEQYGTWIAIYAFYNLIQVFESSHANYVGNAFNRLVHKQPRAAKTLIGSAIRINFFIGLLQLSIVCILYFLGIFKYFLDAGTNDAEVTIILLILFLHKVVIGTYRGLVVKMLNPFGLIYKSFQFAYLERIVEFLILVAAAMSYLSLVNMAWVWFVVKGIYSLWVLFELKKLMPDYFPWWRYGTFSFGIQNFYKSLSFAVSNFMDRLSNDGIVLLVSAFAGTTMLPLFSATKTLVNFGAKISDFFLDPLTPEMINYFALNYKNRVLDIFKSYWYLTGMLLTCSFAISIPLIDPIFERWTNYQLNFNLTLYVGLVLIFMVQNYGSVISAFFMGINKARVVLLSSILRVTVFVGVAYLVKFLGIYAILLGLLISELIVSGVYLPLQSFSIFNLEKQEKLKFMSNLGLVICLGGVYLIFYLGLPIWLIIILLAGCVVLAQLQYRLISKEARVVVFEKLKKYVPIKL